VGQVVSEELVAGCPTGWKESLNGKNWELATWFRVTCRQKLAEAVNLYNVCPAPRVDTKNYAQCLHLCR
jgi:hypothetical protein